MSVLDEILDGVREDTAARERVVSLAHLRSRARDRAPALDPLPGLRGADVAIIAEVKRRSPSKGALADITDPAFLATEYAAGGAAAISVLTEQRRFGGTLDDLAAVRAAVTVPVLRKDFVTTAYQLWEARAWGADLVLLMVVALPGGLLDELYGLSRELGLTALVEAHTEDELRRAVDLKAPLIGVNARDMTTLDLDPSMFARLAPLIPDDRIRVAESAVTTAADVAAYRRHGADAVLTGEALVRSGTPRSTVAEFITAAR